MTFQRLNARNWSQIICIMYCERRTFASWTVGHISPKHIPIQYSSRCSRCVVIDPLLKTTHETCPVRIQWENIVFDRLKANLQTAICTHAVQNGNKVTSVHIDTAHCSAQCGCFTTSNACNCYFCIWYVSKGKRKSRWIIITNRCIHRLRQTEKYLWFRKSIPLSYTCYPLITYFCMCACASHTFSISAHSNSFDGICICDLQQQNASAHIKFKIIVSLFLLPKHCTYHNHGYHWICFHFDYSNTFITSVVSVIVGYWENDDVIIQIYAFCFSQRINNLHIKTDREYFIIVLRSSAVCTLYGRRIQNTCTSYISAYESACFVCLCFINKICTF